MKVHTLFVEPANYTQDLIENVYQKSGINYSFLNSDSIATNNNTIVASAKHLFDKNSLWQNMSFLWNCSRENDLIIINGYNTISFVFLWFFSIVNACHVGIESDTPYLKRTGLLGIIKKGYLRFLFLNKKIIGLPGGNGLHRDLFLNYGIPDHRIFFLPMMVNNRKYYKTIPNEFLDANKTIKFIFVGRLVPEKNVQLLIESFQAVLAKGKKAELKIIGDGICKNELLQMIGGNTAIRLLGKKFGSDLLLDYQEAHVLILPSAFEPWGLVVNEAMAAGLPVVCSSVVGAVYDLVLKPNTGWVFEDNNAAELTELLLNIIENQDQIRIKAQRGQEFMMNHWNYELYTQCLNQLIEYVEKV
ncbi:MAG: hypothetical protein RLZZ540_341 [Bacteroidota bacterium]|jgi:glycosyltransferase involved in cell wall biosynthesis